MGRFFTNSTQKSTHVESLYMQQKANNKGDKNRHITFRIKGIRIGLAKNGKSGKSRIKKWQPFRRIKNTAISQDKLLAALNAAATKDIGAKGPLLVKKHMEASEANTVDIDMIDRVGKNVKVLKLGVDIGKAVAASDDNPAKLGKALTKVLSGKPSVSQMMETPQGAHLLKAIARQFNVAKNVDFLVEIKALQEVMDSSESPILKAQAFRDFRLEHINELPRCETEFNFEGADLDRVNEDLDLVSMRRANSVQHALDTAISNKLKTSDKAQPDRVAESLLNVKAELGRPLIDSAEYKRETFASLVDSVAQGHAGFSELTYILDYAHKQGGLTNDFLDLVKEFEIVTDQDVEKALTALGIER